MKTSLSFALFATFISISAFLESSNGVDFLSANQIITHPRKIISASGIFELGFFSPRTSKNYYLGIMYRNIPEEINVIWVANRDYPVRSSSANLSIGPDGNIVIIDGKMSYKVTNNSISSNTRAVLLDSGNLILRDAKSKAQVFWQSFDYPTDTLLPGMKLGHYRLTGYNWSLVSWRSKHDPAPGAFSVTLDSSGKNLIIKQGNKTHWKGSSSTYGLVPDHQWNQRESSRSDTGYLTYNVDNQTISKIVLDSSGQLKRLSWSEAASQWESLLPLCELSPCGAFSICSETADIQCSCLPGFRRIPDGKKKGETSKDCGRIQDLQCASNLGEDGFYRMVNVEFPKHAVEFNATKCLSACLSNCSCIAYAFDDIRGCLVWYEDLFDLKKFLPIDGKGRDFYLRLASSKFISVEKNTGKGRKRQIWTVVVLTISIAVLALGLFIHYMRRKLIRKGKNLLLLDLGMSLKADTTELTEDDKHGQGRKREIKLPLFSFTSVSAATDNFSAANKLGEGGFGPVYKGKLIKGEEVAVKRLSGRSGQGWEELKNEALVIAKLQHKNLVRLLGCCIERDEKILIYEYMPNKSLDCFLFDPTKCKILDWGMRVRIVEGVAQGLLYLHQYSRLRIIHRDLKASNILLDRDMNPKISDFGMARIFGENELQANTNRIVGTYGYMSPEYALEGLFSIKSDVFSFGVLLLETVSGKKNTGFYQTASLNLLGYAWEIWTSNRVLDLVDPILLAAASSTQIQQRYVHIALLCVQESPADRPNMFDVVSMLSNESALLPSPKQPAFSNWKSTMDANRLVSSRDTCSANDMTTTNLEAR